MREREELRRIKILLSRALQRSAQESFAHIQSHISALYLPTVFTSVTVQQQLLLKGDKHKHHSPLPQPLSRFGTSALRDYWYFQISNISRHWNKILLFSSPCSSCRTHLERCELEESSLKSWPALDRAALSSWNYERKKIHLLHPFATFNCPQQTAHLWGPVLARFPSGIPMKAPSGNSSPSNAQHLLVSAMGRAFPCSPALQLPLGSSAFVLFTQHSKLNSPVTFRCGFKAGLDEDFSSSR